MKILIDINHPAHVHLLRNTYKELIAHGHEVHVVVKDIPSAKKLMDIYGIPYKQLGEKNDHILIKGLEQIVYDLKIWWLAVRHRIDIGVGSSINLAHVSKLCKMKSIILDDDDDEVEPLFAKYAHPFSDAILSPDCIHRDAMQTIGYPSYHDLAYLHPYRFTPDPNVLKDLGIQQGEPYYILRFNAFKAHHDVGAAGLSIEDKRKLIQLLSQSGKVYITTEREIDEEFRPYQLKISPEQIHSLMYYATMFVGDSQSMTSEAAVLGTPAIKCNTFAHHLAVPNEIEERYQLCYSYLPTETNEMFAKIGTLLAIGPDTLKAEWAKRKERLLSEKIDYTAFLVWFFEHYPESTNQSKNADAAFWQQFK